MDLVRTGPAGGPSSRVAEEAAVNGKRLPLLIAAVLPMGAPGAARADTPPSVWEVAADPGAARSWNRHVRVDGLREERPASGAGEGELRLGARRAMTENAAAS